MSVEKSVENDNVKPRASLKLLVSLVLVYALSLPAHAADRLSKNAGEIVQIKGLSLYCPSCRQHDDGFCELESQGELVLVHCDEMLDHILPELALGKYNGVRPSALELRNFLMTETPSYPAARASFELLMQSEKGIQILRENALTFTDRYLQLVEECVNEGVGTPQVWKSYWDALGSGNRLANARLRAIIAHRHPDLTQADLFSDLRISDPKWDMQALSIWEETLRLLGSTWAEDFKKVRGILPACLSASKEAAFIGCQERDFEDLSPSASAYLKRVQVQTVINLLEHSPIGPMERIKVLSGIPYESFRTPSTHQVMLSSLQELEGESEGEGIEELFGVGYLAMLSVFSRNDPEIAQTLGRLLAEQASRIGEAEVSRLLDVLGVDVEQYSAEKETLLKKRGIALGGIAAVFFLGTVAIRKKRRKVSKIRISRTGLSPEERVELRRLRLYFDLKPDASPDDLVRRYRQKARVLHPDVRNGNAAAFSALSERYERAKELLGRL